MYFLPARRLGESYKNQALFKRNSHSKNFWSCLKIIETSYFAPRRRRGANIINQFDPQPDFDCNL
ncbi:MAG: hypothetical protein LBR79_04380 [Oscillospiraceae bacterium]|nr:hypothetical protein [Oscillospiraceae bacterium]